jgi:hypothetical protein
MALYEENRTEINNKTTILLLTMLIKLSFQGVMFSAAVLTGLCLLAPSAQGPLQWRNKPANGPSRHRL